MFLIVMLMQLILHSHQILNKCKVVPSLCHAKVKWLLCNHAFLTYEGLAIDPKYLYLLIIKLKTV